MFFDPLASLFNKNDIFWKIVLTQNVYALV